MPRTLNDEGLTKSIVGLAEARKVLALRLVAAEQLAAEAEAEHNAVLKAISGLDAAMELLRAEITRREVLRAAEAEKAST